MKMSFFEKGEVIAVVPFDDPEDEVCACVCACVCVHVYGSNQLVIRRSYL